MKKYLFLGFLFILLFLLININKSNTYAFTSCDNFIINPYEVNTLNLENYLNNINYREVKSFCSYEKCYKVREKNIYESVNNFNDIYYKKLSDSDKYIISVKGFPITKIVINNC